MAPPITPPVPVEAVTFDFFNTLVFHREGRGRGRILMQYLERHGLQPESWQHDVLYQVFALHDRSYSPASSPQERAAYYTELAARVFDYTAICWAEPEAAEHAEALWAILGPACFAVFPDVTDTLRALEARRIPLAVVSNWQSGLRHFCTELGLSRFFEQVLCSADLGFAKPGARIFLEACTLLGVAPERTLHVGDTYQDDYVGAQSAGLQVLLIDRNGTAGVGARSSKTLAGVLECLQP